MSPKKLKARRNHLICRRGRLRNRAAAVNRSLRSARKPETKEALHQKLHNLVRRTTRLEQHIAKLA